MGGSVLTIKENVGSLLMTSKESGLEVNVDKTKYMVLYHKQKAGRIHSTIIENWSLEIVEHFKYLVKTLTKQNLY